MRHQYLDTLDKGCYPLPDATIQEMHTFFSYCAGGAYPTQHVGLLEHSTAEQYSIPFYVKMMKSDRFIY